MGFGSRKSKIQSCIEVGAQRRCAPTHHGIHKMSNSLWWQTTTIYQIYPRSYKDSNNDGIGDIQGIISKLDYIKDLGFETIWISPFFASPQQDFGYDISDYLSIAPEYGTMADVEALIAEVHSRGMRILFDLVMNHTSVEHAWFQESRRSRDNPKRDWYIWRDGRGGNPPNNWTAIPGGSGWHCDEHTEQWYYASFLPFQPDLNYRNPKVRETMLDVARYWLDKGVDGYRLDIFHSVYKDEQFRDNPFSWHYIPHNDEAGFFQKWTYTLHQPETFTLAKDLRVLAESYNPPKMLIGEIFGSDEVIKKYIGEQQDGLNMVFLWDLLKTKPATEALRDVIQQYEARYPAPYTPVYVYGNHDQKRIISKVGGQPKMAKLLALLQLTARGVPVVYYGEEIGMAEVNIPARKAKDPVGQRYKWVPGFLVDALNLYVNRDGCRTPMHWHAGPNAGFNDGETQPWLPVHENYLRINVQQQLEDDDSVLQVYRRLLHLRRENTALREGNLQLLEGASENSNLLIYQRSWNDDSVVVVINFSSDEQPFANRTGHDIVFFGVGLQHSGKYEGVSLPPFSGVILGKEFRNSSSFRE